MMRPHKVGWGIVGLFLIGGIGFWIAMPEIFIGQIWVAVSLFLAFYYYRMGRRADAAEDMQRTGVRGQAQILEMTQTGVYVNEQPRVKLKLHIQAPGVAPFEDEKTHTVPLIALGRLSDGMPLTVFLRPEQPEDYVIDWFGGGGPTQAGQINVQSTTGGPIDVAPGSEAGQAVMAALKQHGVDTSGGSVDLRSMAGAREAVLKALRDHGVDVAHQVAARDPATPVQDEGEPIERMTKLKQLRDADLITDEEYEQSKKRILGEL